MKKLVLLALLCVVSACAPTQSSSLIKDNKIIQCGVMCQQCPCCQKMMQDNSIKDDKVKEEKMIQCPLIGNSTNSEMKCPLIGNSTNSEMKCPYCQKMMGSDTSKNKAVESNNTGAGAMDHDNHSPAK
ncbi:MAG: hypothetical protein ACOYK8_06065 [Alphaproteobacteria bacterium]